MFNSQSVFSVRGGDSVPEGGAGDALVDVGHARVHLGLHSVMVPIYPRLQVSVFALSLESYKLDI